MTRKKNRASLSSLPVAGRVSGSAVSSSPEKASVTSKRVPMPVYAFYDFGAGGAPLSRFQTAPKS